MTPICPKCGALLLGDTENCTFCDVPFAESEEIPQPVTAGSAGFSEDTEPEWRREVSRRLREYRARRHQLCPDDSQSDLPFHDVSDLEDELPERPRPRSVQRRRQVERVEIRIQPEFDFSGAPDDRMHPESALVPVASLSERRRAAALDTLFLGLTVIAFLGLFRSLGGQITLAKMDAIVSLAVAYLFYAQYFFLFTVFAGSTPGMQLCGLTIVRLNGSLPDTQQLLWRSFGYLLSGTTLMLGFLWALWDEDHFTWQDRISRTYITAATPVMGADSLEVGAGRRTFAHR